jgi:uncharacterized peroxidase-related enzyme
LLPARFFAFLPRTRTETFCTSFAFCRQQFTGDPTLVYNIRKQEFTMSAWIRMIADKDADDTLKSALDTARTPHGTVDNVMRVHSLRPSTMNGHVALYRACLHDDANTLAMWFQEVISSYVSTLNNCPYSYANHWANARHLIGDDAKADRVEAALQERKPEAEFSGVDLALLQYAEKLTLSPGQIVQADVQILKDAGVEDGEILEANQIIGYFNYANRLLNGLGVTTDGDVVGFYAGEPTDAP